jgi:hypothetical protein
MAEDHHFRPGQLAAKAPTMTNAESAAGLHRSVRMRLRRTAAS